MKKLLQWLFPPNDWKVVEAIQGEWKVDRWVNEDFKHWGTYRCTERCLFEICYSKYRDKYKIHISGYQPEHHSSYVKAVEILNSYESTKSIKEETGLISK